MDKYGKAKSMTTGMLYLCAGFVIALCTLISEWLSRKELLSYFNSRKLLHIVAISVCTYVIWKDGGNVALGYIFLGLSVALAIIVVKQALSISKGKSLGIALFPLAFAILILGRVPTAYIVTAGLILAWADAIGGWYGYHYGRPWLLGLLDKKSIGGSVIFYLTAIIIVTINHHTSLSLQSTMLLVFVITISEMISYKGSDNLTVPIVTALGLTLLI